jgi:hypothetical protein
MEIMAHDQGSSSGKFTYTMILITRFVIFIMVWPGGGVERLSSGMGKSLPSES